MSIRDLWLALDASERQEAMVLYAGEGPASKARVADLARGIPRYRSFRPQALLKLSNHQLADAAATRKDIPEGDIENCLIALHLQSRSAILSAFLDALSIPHSNGIIAEGYAIALAEHDAELRGAILGLFQTFPRKHVLTYLLCLTLLDKKAWHPLLSVLPGILSGATPGS